MTPRPPFGERGGSLRGLVDLATGCYPAFLFGGSLSGVLPVFHFHDVTRDWLEPRLLYLRENGYRAVTADEIARFVIDGVDHGPRAVALTFDDARASVWTVATPLIAEYGLKIILFAIPGRVVDAPSVRAPGATGGDVFATWPELRAMHASGVVDIQSHTRSHAMIFWHERLVGFVTPDYAHEDVLARPIVATNGAAHFLRPDELGTPLYPRRSRMSDARRFLADERAAERCRDHVSKNGGARFFDDPAWRSQLETIAFERAGGFEADDTRAATIRAELVEGRALLNEKLGTTSVKHVALPWGISGAVTRGMLADAGYATAFAERPLKRRGVRAGDDRFQLMRLNAKFLTCLPGRGRQWFFNTVR